MLLRELSMASSPSGYEGQVRKEIKEEASKYVDEIIADRMGNIITHKKGKGTKIAIATSIDEAGFIISSINKDGSLKFLVLGNIDKRIVPGKVVYIGENKISGIIGIKPIHLQNKKDREEVVPVENLVIDIGSKDKQESENLITIGDYAVFNSEYSSLGNDLIKGKAVGNRIGCSILIDILKDDYKCDLYGVFNSQGEVGMRGAITSTYKIDPDVILSIEPVWSNDISIAHKKNYVSSLGKGPVLIIADDHGIYDKEIIERIRGIADKDNINIQLIVQKHKKLYPNTFVLSGRKAKIIRIGIPCRYLNSPNSICSLEDYKKAIRILKEYLKSV